LQKTPHIPVLAKEVVAAFEHLKDGIVVDCTLGYGGHSALLLESNPNIRIIGIDQDESAIRFSTQRLEMFGERMQIKRGRFAEVIQEIIKEQGSANIRGVLADIGVSSLQLDQKERGFSFESDTLDMRMDATHPLSAADVVNGYDTLKLQQILRDYGEIKNYKKIADFIVKNRPFHSAKELSDTLRPLLQSGKKIHPATLLLQAIRIEVNDELGQLNTLLEALTPLTQAVIAIISFHSLEDRIVKQKFTAWSKKCICPPEAHRCTCGANNALGKIVTKKPITADKEELACNPRSRSAKLRVFEMEHER
jgi:16S rRNA (cytosine1402-N4)-methyltransferase